MLALHFKCLSSNHLQLCNLCLSSFGLTQVATSKSADRAIVDPYKIFIQHRVAVVDLGGVNSMRQTEASVLLDLGTKDMQLSRWCSVQAHVPLGTSSHP